MLRKTFPDLVPAVPADHSSTPISANGKKIAEGRLEKTVPVQYSIVEGLDIGKDGGSPIDWTYKMPYAFTGKIEKVAIDLK